MAVALTGLITLAGNFLFDALRAQNDATLALQAEDKRFQLQLLQNELSQRETELERAKALLFLVRAGVLDDLDRTELEAMAKGTIQREGGDPEQPSVPSFLPTSLGFDPTPAELETTFNTAVTSDLKFPEIEQAVDRIIESRERYEKVAASTGLQWTVIGALHYLENSLAFNRHLHNGDPLTSRTTHVPRGRPATGEPPFTWEESAIDALELRGLAGNDFSTFGEVLAAIERFNGLGYRRRGIYSPYLWACTSAYSRGSFLRDGVFYPDAVAKRCGAVPLLKRLRERGFVLTQAAGQ